MNYKGEGKPAIVLIKGITGLIACFAAALILETSIFNAELALQILGIVTILIGIGFIAVSKYLK